MLRLTLALALVTALGSIRLYDPIGGDQALFLVAARELAHGAILYRDFWDLKQPGIFGFYAVAGRFGAFAPEALHAFELLWNLALGVVSWGMLRSRLAHPAFAIAAPLSIVGGTYAVADGSALTQVELLAGLPLALCAWSTLAGFELPYGRRALALAATGGVAAAVAILFKLVFVAIALAIVGAAYARRIRAALRDTSLEPTMAQTPTRSARELVAAWLVATAVPLVAFALFAWLQGTLAEIVTTFFVLPSRIVASVGHAPPQRLAESARWFAMSFGYLLPFAVVGATTPQTRDGARDVALAYLFAALAVIVVQVQSWWMYQFLLIVPPLGILATLGIDRVADVFARVPSKRWIATVALASTAIAFVPCGATIARSVARIVRDRPFSSAAADEAYRLRTSGGYARAAAIATYLEGPTARVGGVYVAGDPRIYFIAGRDQAVPINGWALELYPPERWRALEAQFVAIAPRFVFVSSDYSELVRTRSHAISARLSTAYAVAKRTPDGTWYRAR